MLAVAFDIVDCKMFDRGGELEMVEVVSLQTTNIGDAHATREIRIFAEHFLDAPPARIAADINNRRPIYEAMLGSRSLRFRIVESTCLIGHGVGDGVD